MLVGNAVAEEVEVSPKSVAAPLAEVARDDDAEVAKRRTSDRLLILAPESFYPALKDFIAYKQSLPIAEFVSLETTLKSSPGVDDPEKLKQFLFSEWKKRGLGYVLLVGDVNVMPVRYMVLYKPAL